MTSPSPSCLATKTFASRQSSTETNDAVAPLRDNAWVAHEPSTAENNDWWLSLELQN